MEEAIDIPNPHALEYSALLNQYNVKPKLGLTDERAHDLQSTYGKNELPCRRSKGLIAIFFSQFKNPLIYLLLIAVAITFFVGEVSDPIVILVVLLINAIVGTVQEGRAKRALEALQKLSAPQATVIRHGERVQIASSDLVPGDILVLSSGDRISADARVIDAKRLSVDESSLTGESRPVEKINTVLPEDSTLFKRANMVYSGTQIIAGSGLAVVIAIGEQSYLGAISKLTVEESPPPTPLEKRIARFGNGIAIAALFFFCALLAIGILRKLQFGEVLLAAVSQMVSMIPEGLPVAMTIAMAVGVQKMAKRHAIIRKLIAVETLGSTTVICTDKTGTLTQNEMTVTDIVLGKEHKIEVSGVGYCPEGSLSSQPDELKRLLQAGALCNEASLILKNGSFKTSGDPLEIALLAVSHKASFDPEFWRKEYERTDLLPFSSQQKFMASEHHIKGKQIVAIKGALESILSFCSEIEDQGARRVLSEEDKKVIESQALEFAKQGKRIIAIAQIDGLSLADVDWNQSGACFLGFVALIDPLRPEVKEAVEACRAAGIKPIIVTGDHAETAKAIAAQIGLTDGLVIEGEELDKLSQEELKSKILEVSIFARVLPEQKLKIVEALQARGEVVAMTGDGVNDAPALVRANVGVAMGLTGTEVAKQAAEMVIADDRFATIVHAIEEGRIIYNNIKKVLFYLLSTSLPAAALMIIAIGLGFPLPLSAVQILWINIITEGTVTINLILDPPEGDEMKGMAKRAKKGLFTFRGLLRMAYLILVIGSLLLGYFVFAQPYFATLQELQTSTFTLLAFCAWFNVMNCKSFKRSVFELPLLKNRYLVIGILIGIALHLCVLYLPLFNRLFHTTPLSPIILLVLLLISSIVLWAEELRKYIANKL